MKRNNKNNQNCYRHQKNITVLPVLTVIIKKNK